MDRDLRNSTLDYYSERAAEYEEVYIRGTGSASIKDPNLFKSEAVVLSKIVGNFAHGSLIDIACGTGFWLPYYQVHCSSITFFDQSENMLAECTKKVKALGIEGKCTFLCGNFFNHQFAGNTYDCAIAGFFVSHISEDQEIFFFDTLRKLLNAKGRFLIFDSAWNEERAKVNKKEERQKRHLNNGSTFDIYKRYFDKDDIFFWGKRHSLDLSLEYFGPGFLAASGKINRK